MNTMTYIFWQKIAMTPWWMFLIFFYLIRIGWIATKSRIVSIRGLLITPVFFIPISLISIYAIAQITLLSGIFWLITCFIGILFGFLQFRLNKIKAIKDENKLHVPGTWSALMIVILIIAAKYYFGYDSILDLAYLSQPKFVETLLALYGFLSGILIGRAILALRCVKEGPYL